MSDAVNELKAIRKLLARLVLVNERLALHLGADLTVEKKPSGVHVESVPKRLTDVEEQTTRRSTMGPLEDTGLTDPSWFSGEPGRDGRG